MKENPDIEYRISKSILRSSATAEDGLFQMFRNLNLFGSFEFRILNLIRASCFLSAFLILLSAVVSYAMDTAVFRGRIFGVKGNPVAGAEIFVYNNPDTRRPADFISARTGPDGKFRMSVPPGKYWVVARLRHGEKYGPLMTGDRHSGEPAEIDFYVNEKIAQDFTVVDIKEAARLVKKTREDYFRMEGRIIDKNGSPVKNVYAVACRKKEMSGMPDYMSAWTDDEGRYALYLPDGRYFVGYASEFPPGPAFEFTGEIHLTSGKTGFDIIAGSGDGQ